MQRILTLKTGRSGLKEEDFEVKTYREDDGENRAGMTIVDTLAHGAVDVVVVVSRWFGGASFAMYSSHIRNAVS